MKVLMIAPPGAGKGTQGVVIASHFDIPHIATGDLLRDHVARKTDLGQSVQKYMDRGELVPDEVVLDMVREAFIAAKGRGYVLDGIPRTMEQARALYDLALELDMTADVALNLTVDDEEVVRRLSGRRTCRTCGHVWHLDFDQPAREGLCDHCGGELFQRDDDKAETIRHRLEVYAQQTSPLVDYYGDRSILVGIDATGPVEDITERAISALRRYDR